MQKGKTHNRNDCSADIIGSAALELKRGDVVNIGIGIPGTVGKYASESGILNYITLTVESGGIGGLPASGRFRRDDRADAIYHMSMQFDFYDGGGLDICFLNFGLTVSEMSTRIADGCIRGNRRICQHSLRAKTVVFCLTFTKGQGLLKDGMVCGNSEGRIPKFKEEIRHKLFC